MTLNVTDWPVKWRRAFLLTLPVSVPLWIVAAVLFMVGAVLILAICAPICAVVELWRKRSYE